MGDGKTTSCPNDGGAAADDEGQIVAAFRPSDVFPKCFSKVFQRFEKKDTKGDGLWPLHFLKDCEVYCDMFYFPVVRRTTSQIFTHAISAGSGHRHLST